MKKKRALMPRGRRPPRSAEEGLVVFIMWSHLSLEILYFSVGSAPASSSKLLRLVDRLFMTLETLLLDRAHAEPPHTQSADNRIE